MKTTTLILILLIVITTVSCNNNESTTMEDDIKAPVAAKKDTVIKGGGGDRIDPYFWMRLTDAQKNAEVPDEHTKEVLDYLKAENAFKEKKMEHTVALQEKLYDEITGRIKKTDESVPYFKNEYWYYVRYEEGGEYPIYCRKKGSLDTSEEILLNVNEMAKGHDYYYAGSVNISPDNKIMAYSEDTLSRRVYSIQFKNLETGELLSDQLINTTGRGAWANDNKTFFYTTKNKVSLLSEKIYKHKMGVNPADDELIYHEKDPSFYIGVGKTKSDEYVVIGMNSTLVSDYMVLRADEPDGKFKQFIPRGSQHEYSIEHFKDKFYILTNYNAQNFRLMETPVNNTAMPEWKEVIPHREDVLINSFEVFENYLVLSERSNALNKIRVINQNAGDEHYIEMNETAYAANTAYNPEFKTELLRFSYSSLTTPGSVYDYNMNTRAKELKKRDEVVGGHNPEDYTTKRLWATARDGAKVPISIVYKKGFNQDGNAPVLLYGYGSYGHTIQPYFNSAVLSLLDRNFAYAIAHIRGSQAMGRAWYDDGKMFNKKNTFYDFIDCGQYLVDEKFTSSDHLYIKGGSAGGLLMGAVVNIAPDLFNGAIAAVPFVDVVSTMLDESIPLTTNEFDEWGNPKDFELYNYMLSYSPYDNVSEQDYPNMLITTGLFDSQVQYWEPAKWVARLREKKTDNNLLLLDTDLESGHGGASGRFKRYKRTALEYAFMLDLEGIVE
ncbi:MAG: S9 family peptidase [Bacteroidota bacterium]